MSDPIFPPELEEVIFTNALAVKSDGESALNLLLVARRIHYAWLMQTLIKTIAISHRRVSSLRKYPFRWDISTLERYGMHTRHFFIWESDFQQEGIKPAQYFSSCPNITNLWCDSDLDQDDVELFSFLPLTHLSIDLNLLPEPTAKILQIYSGITHLETFNGFNLPSELDQKTPLQYFTSLTHLAITEEHDQDFIPFFFGNIPTLQVLIFRRRSDGVGGSRLRGGSPRGCGCGLSAWCPGGRMVIGRSGRTRYVGVSR
ncbi:hypothetical protein BDN72DRAFT_840182 [Pluteus cervinus]|uniref:Uncharacterized protein n=1 Tax=Pluteus cervinus TaxID=181527 RepID=A0ACD3AVD6_9AGAR|nr:hypothetical protein BDN72DRAFT_840182 [Pluteus cervinus]